MALAHRRQPRCALLIRADEQRLDHRVGTEQIQTVHEQLRIGRDPLQDGTGEQLPVAGTGATAVDIGLQQRHQPLQRHREIQRVGPARGQHQRRLIQRRALQVVVTQLRAQMAAGQRDRGAMDLEPICGLQHPGELMRDLEVRMQRIGGRTLRDRDQPPRITHQHRQSGRARLPQRIEQRLHLRQARSDLRRPVIRDAHHQQLQLVQQVEIEQCLREAQTHGGWGPAPLPPQVERPDHHLAGIRKVVVQARHVPRREAARPVCPLQLPAQRRLVRTACIRGEKRVLEGLRQRGLVLPPGLRLLLRIEQRVDGCDGGFAAGQETGQQFDMRLERHAVFCSVRHI